MITICLTMIVKDEEKVILRCLNSVVDYIDTYCICDTGSTDSTPKLITDFFEEKGIKGKLLHHKWKNFGYNRTLAVQEAKGTADYLLLMDADFIFKVVNPNFKNNIHTAGSYLIKYEGVLDYRQPLMVSGKVDWKYIGVTHEYIHSDQAITRAYGDDFVFNHLGDGANKNDKFIRDIGLLQEGLEEEPDNSRYYFYLGQSHKDLGCQLKQEYLGKKKTLENVKLTNVEKHEATRKMLDKIKEQVPILEKKYQEHLHAAIAAYEKRITFTDFPEEIYYATYMLGFCHYHLESPPHIFTGYFMQASAIRPSRLEALYNLVKYWRVQEKYQIAYDLGYRASKQPYPKTDCLFIDSRIHNYTFKHEVAICAFYLGRFQECLDLINDILEYPDVLDNHRKQIEQHKQMTLQRLREQNKSRQGGNPLITFFSYNKLGTGGSEISDWGLLRYLSKENDYNIKHSRDYREIIQDKPDVILAQQYAIEKGVKIGSELGIPVIVTQHGPDQWGHGLNSCYFIFNSNTLANSEIPKADFKNFDIVWPCIDVLKFKNVGLNNSFDRKYITFIGRPLKIKGIETFMKIADLMPEQDFLFVGGKPEFDLKIPNNVELRDFTNKPEEVYAQSRIVLVPSLFEPFGMVTVEASLVGIPVIASKLDGMIEATSKLSNYIEDYENPNEWVATIRHVLMNYPNQCRIADQIGKKYIQTMDEQLTKFNINVKNLLANRGICPYTRGIKFTVAITVYNRPQKVLRAIQSVIDQTIKDWEIIVVDDCSTDDTWDNLIEFHHQNKDHCFKMLQNDKNEGTFHSRNVAIDEATGDFIINLDSDDMLVPNALESLRDQILKNNAKIVQFKYYRDVEEKLKTFDTLSQLAPEVLHHKDSSWGLFCFEKDYVQQYVGYYDCIRYGADTEFMCRLKNFHQVSNLNQIIYYAEDDETSLSKAMKKEWSNQYLRNFMKWYSECKKANGLPYMPFPGPEKRPFKVPTYPETQVVESIDSGPSKLTDGSVESLD